MGVEDNQVQVGQDKPTSAKCGQMWGTVRVRSGDVETSVGGGGVFDDLEEEAERAFDAGLGVNEEDRGSARAGSGRFIDDVEAFRHHGVVRRPCVLHAEADVGKSAPAAVFLYELLDWGFRSERFEQLDEIRAASDLEQYFADLIRAFYFFAVQFSKPEQLVGLDLAIE